MSFESRIISSGAFSLCMPPRRRGITEGEMRAKDLAIDLDDLSGDEVHLDLGPCRRNLKLRFPSCQANVDACSGAVNDSIRDTYLQRGLKGHPST